MKYSGLAASTYPDIKHIAPNREMSTDAFLSFCFVPSFKRRTAFLVRMSIGVNDETRMKSPRKMIIVKIMAAVGQYKYKPGTCVILAVTNKKELRENKSKLNAEKDGKNTN